MDMQARFKRAHPLVLIAASAVIVLCVVGTGVLTGLIPSAYSSRSDGSAASLASATAPVTDALPIPPAPGEVQSGPAPASANPAPTTGYAAPPAATYAPAPEASSGAYAVPAPQVAAACYACGVVESVQTVESPGRTTGVGAVAGGVGGAVVGNELGRGRDRGPLTILGAIGGAFAGNAIEKHVHKVISYHLHVRMDDGSYRNFPESHIGNYAVGERVRVDNNGALVHAG